MLRQPLVWSDSVREAMIANAEPGLRGRSHPLGKVRVLVWLGARRAGRGFEVIAQAPHQCRIGRGSDVECILDGRGRQSELRCESCGIETGEVEIRAQLRAGDAALVCVQRHDRRLPFTSWSAQSLVGLCTSL